MKYLLVDGMLHGTGIRDGNAGGYIELEELRLSESLIDRIQKWLLQYEDEHYEEFSNKEAVDKLDEEGKEITVLVKSELNNVKVDYFSNAKMSKVTID